MDGSWSRGHAVHDLDPLARTGARGQDARDLGRGVEVVVVDDGRAGGVLHVDQRGQGHAVALGVADLQSADVLDAHAVLRVGLDVDLPVAVLEGEVVDVVRSQIGLQGIVDVVQRHGLGLGLLAVDFDEDLRLGHAEGGEEARRCPAGAGLRRPWPARPLAGRAARRRACPGSAV